MAVATPAEFELGHHFKAREARDNLREVLDVAERGGAAVIWRDSPVVAVGRAALDAALSRLAPFEVSSSVTESQVAFWLDGAPVHAVGSDLDEASESFLDALVDYAQDWVDELHRAPNHAENQLLVLRIMMFAGDRGELARVVFGD